MAEPWKTSITSIKPNELRVRGYDIAELMGTTSFGAVVYLTIMGELPSAPVGKLMDGIMVSSVDHGPTPPSALAARTVASTGAALSQAVAAGIMSINESHGGAIENCARQLKRISERAKTEGVDLQTAAAHEIVELKAKNVRMSGFGHRIHTADPRTAALLKLVKEAGAVGGAVGGVGIHVETALAVEGAFTDAGKNLPLNVDGTIGAILADLGFPYEVMNGIFMIARCVGLVAHVAEEQNTQRRMRAIDPINHTYVGPEPRSI